MSSARLRALLLAAVAGLLAAAAAPLAFADVELLRSLEWMRPALAAVPLAALYLGYRACAAERELVQLRRSVRRLRRREEELKHQAFHDPLTKLANRDLFADRVERALAARARDTEPLAVLFVDLDDFKMVNDTWGHAAGDALLMQAAERLRSCVRPADTSARLGGDEFAVLLEDTAAPEGAIRTAERILAAMRTPFAVDGSSVAVHASVGVALSDPFGIDTISLLRNADVAMYRAKRARSGYAVYAFEHDDYNPQRLALVGELRRAFEQRELYV